VNCAEVRAALAAYLEADPPLAADPAEALRAHLADCPACRAEAEALREQLALLRGAGAWAAEVGAEAAARFPAGRPNAGPGRSAATRRALRLAVGAAAAGLLAVAGVWTLVAGNPPDQAGKMVGTVEKGVILHGGSPAEALYELEGYRVPAGHGALVRLADGTPLWIGGASSFTVSPGNGGSPCVELHCGSVVCASVTPVEVRWHRMSAFACGWFAMGAPGEAPGSETGAPAQSIWSDWLFPPAQAAEDAATPADRGPAVFLLLSGWTELRVGEEELSLVGRRVIFGGDGRSALIGPPEGLISSAAAERRGLVEGLLSPRYRSMKAEYSARLRGYLARLAAADVGEEERQDLAWRIALLEELCAAQDARLEGLSAVEGPRERRAALLGLRIARLRALGQEIAAAESHVAPRPPEGK
jgi:hypothetical protein